MSGDPNSITPISSPPNLPPFLKKVHDPKPIISVPTDEELIGIHAVIRVANQVVDVQDLGDSVLLARLSEHLFNAQMAKYRNKNLGIIFPEDMIYNPPILPIQLSVQLEPVTGAPSEEEIIKVQGAVRFHQQHANSPSIFDPQIDMELSQRLFDIQMARYTQRARQNHIGTNPHNMPGQNPAGVVERVANIAEEIDSGTNNPGTGADEPEPDPVIRELLDSVHDALERSNRLADQTNQLARRSNQLIERSNQIAERSNQIAELSSQPVEQSNKIFKKFNALFESLNEHLETSNQFAEESNRLAEESNRLAEESTNPTERVGDVLENINRVLVKVQHAIVRNHKGNTTCALDCLVNEKGEIPGVSDAVGGWDLKSLSEHRTKEPVTRIPIAIDGVEHKLRFPDYMLGAFLCFYGIGDDLCKEGDTKLKSGMTDTARERLRTYWTSCLG